MSTNPNKLSQFWQELKRRRVIHVVVVYATVAFVIIELVNNVYETLELPDWTPALILILLIIGFPLAVIFSWIFDVTPGGIEKTKSIEESDSQDNINLPGTMKWKVATFASLIILVALAILHIVDRNKGSGDFREMEKSIAVLPFLNDSPDKENEYFINGTMESILDKLCKIQDLRVIARTSVEQYRDKPMQIEEIAEALNVNYILEGSGQKYENQIRLTVQLIDAKGGDHIWSGQYDKELEDIFSIQSEIAQLIANEIKAIVTPEVKLRIEKKPTENMEAYNLYLQGRHFYSRVSGKEAYEKSIQFYQRALEIDPEFALAYSGIAASYSAFAHGGYLPRSEVMHLARAAAQKALAIDNTLGEAHAELAWTKIYQDFDWDGGEKGLKLALELNPNNAYAHRNYCWLLTMVGRYDESILEAKHALELDPLASDIWAWLARAYIYAGDYDRAIEEFEKFFTNYPDFENARRWFALAYLLKGMNQEALSEIDKVETIFWIDGYIYGIAGEMEKAREVLDHYLERSKTAYVSPTDFTMIYLGLGESDTAMDYLEMAYEQHEGWLVLLRAEPMYDSLRSNPRFQALLDKMNYPDN